MNARLVRLLPLVATALFAQSANQDELLVRGRDRILAAIDRMASLSFAVEGLGCG